ncbi:MAG: type IV secretion system DNA-binding domain-containing protein [Silvanigrellaceae bacterium]|nr:type IV secretion system DNA-binding domain-containing protein [Silvanigrellaceae bacterium]
MKNSNYGLQISSSYISKFLKESSIYITISLIGASILMLISIQFKFVGGVSWYFDLLWKKATLYLSSEIFAFNATEKDKISHSIIDKYWQMNLGDTHLFLITFVIGFILTLILSLYITKKIGIKFKDGVTERNDELHYVEPDVLKKEIKSEVKNKRNNIEFTDYDLVVSTSKIRIPDKTASLHIGMCGAPASGKTNAMDEQLVQERRFGNKVFIMDPRGEFYAKHGKKGDHILSLYDKRAEKWNFWCEDLPPKFLANALIEMKESASSNKFFDKTGREVMAAALRIAKSQEELWQIANYSEEDLYNLLLDNKELSKQYLGKKASGQSAGVIASAFMNLNFIKYLNHHVIQREKETKIKEEEFSLTKWVNNNEDSSWIFIIDENRNLEDAKPLHRLWFDIVTSSSFDRDISKSNLKRISLYCDEISTVGNLPTLPLVFDKGRRFKTKMVIGFQSFPQVEIIYGREMALSIFQGLQNIFVFVSNSGKEAELFSDRMGKSEVIELDTSMSVGGHGHTNLSQRTRRIDSVTASQIQALKDNFAFLKLARFNPTKVEFKYVGLELINQGSISEVPVKSWLDEIEIKPYESKEMIANKQKEELAKLDNLVIDSQNSKLKDLNQSLKLLIDEAVSILLQEPVDSVKLNLSAKKILEKFGASNYTKAKINDIQYVIFINKKNKAIHITYDNTEFTINFPPIDIKNQDSIPEKKETTSDMQGDKKNGATSSANGSPSLGMKSQQQEALKNEMEEKGDKIEFQSIPILIKSPLKKIKTTENNEELEMNNNV